MTVAITEARLFIVRLELLHGFETSSHRKTHLDHIIVRLRTADGLTGWGECASPSDPYYCGETTDSCWHVLGDYLIPPVLGLAWEHPDEITALMARVSGNNFAKAGLEMACWDLYGKQRTESLSVALGGTAKFTEAGVSLGIEADIDALLARVQGHVDEGYRRVKLKIRPGWDREPTALVRAAFPRLQLQVDANTAYRAADIDHLRSLDAFELLMIEQPFAADNLVAHAELARQVSTPVCLDESITSLAALRSALALGACDVVNIKVSRLGGLSAAKAVHDDCQSLGIPVWCGGMHEYGIGRAANLAIASLPGFTLPSDVSGSDKYYARDIVTPAITATDGLVAVPLGPGIGVQVDGDFIDLRALARKTLTAQGATVRQ